MKSSKSKLRFISLFAVMFLLRWVTLPSPLPANWTADSSVKFTARVLTQPEQTDSQTIIKSGLWKIKIDGYAEIMPGERYAFVGRVEPKLLLGKIVKIEMVDPTFAKAEPTQGRSRRISERLILSLGGWREKMVKTLQRSLPEPQASLAAGILLGIKANIPYDFYLALVKTGTLHVIAASGFNVTIVAAAIMRPLLRVIARGWAIGFGVVGIIGYVIMAGASAAVVRAGIMGSLTLIAYLWGRSAEVKRLLWVTAALMLLINPLMLVEVGFQLSVSATAGLLYLEPWIRNRFMIHDLRFKNLETYLADYFYPTLAATAATLPVTAWWFGRISYLSPVVNMLILPLVPLIMFLTALAMVAVRVPILGTVTIWLLYVPLAWMVRVIRWFG